MALATSPAVRFPPFAAAVSELDKTYGRLAVTTRFINIAIPHIWRIPLVLATIGALALAIAFAMYGVEATQGSELAFHPWWDFFMHIHFDPTHLPYSGPTYIG